MQPGAKHEDISTEDKKILFLHIYNRPYDSFIDKFVDKFLQFSCVRRNKPE